MTDLVAAARELRELIETEADAIDAAGTLTARVYDALEDAGLFQLLVPADLGGHEASVDVVIDVCEELSYADGSVGWAFTQNTTVGACLAFVSDATAAQFAPMRAGAGMFAPLGVAVEQDGGYRVSGQFKFGSGSGHALYMGGCGLVMRGEEVAPIGEDGRLPVVGFLLPAERVEIDRRWDVMGLRGTGSYDYVVPEQFVDAEDTWPMIEVGAATIRRGGPIHGLGMQVFGTIGSAAWALGVARRAWDEICQVARGGRVRLGSDALVDQQRFQRDLGFHREAITAARHLLRVRYNAAVAAIEADASKLEVASALRATKAAANFAVHTGKQATIGAYEHSGSTGLRNPSLLQRCFRDIHVGAAHQVFDDRNYIELGKEVLGLETSGF